MIARLETGDFDEILLQKFATAANRLPESEAKPALVEGFKRLVATSLHEIEPRRATAQKPILKVIEQILLRVKHAANQNEERFPVWVQDALLEEIIATFEADLERGDLGLPALALGLGHVLATNWLCIQNKRQRVRLAKVLNALCERAPGSPIGPDSKWRNEEWSLEPLIRDMAFISRSLIRSDDQ